MADIRAKFRATAAEQQGENEMVTLNAVYDADPASPNHEWSKYTPWGELKMSITNPSAQGKLKPGKEYFIDITEAE